MFERIVNVIKDNKAMVIRVTGAIVGTVVGAAVGAMMSQEPDNMFDSGSDYQVEASEPSE